MIAEESPEVPFGRSPMIGALADLRAWNVLPLDERKAAAAQFVEDKISSGEWAVGR